MSDLWGELAPTALGDRLADDLRQMARAYDAAAARSQQTDLGPSEIGSPCTRCLARAALGVRVVRSFDDPWCRTIGTAVHSWLADAAGYANAATLEGGAGFEATLGNLPNRKARWYPEQRVHPDPVLLPSGGSADLYDEETFTVIDHKIVGYDKIKVYRVDGPGEKYVAQGHLYGLGYSRAGYRVDHVAVAFWPRGSTLNQLFVHTEPYSEARALAALDRWRLIRDQALAIGVAILPLLPADSSCFECGGKDVDETATSSNTTEKDPTQP